MRVKNEFQKKAKNSVIYFQLGLIATMLAVLFVLEYNFQDVKKKEKEWVFKGPIVDEPFVYNPIEVKPEVTKPVSKPVTLVETKPVIPQKVVTDFKVEDDKVEVEKEDNLATQDNTTKAENPTSNNSSTVNTGATTTSNNGSETILSVEQLPMFKACKGLSREEQKECFESELAKVVSRNLIYPKDDYADGIQGRTFVEFIIDENGNITNVNSLGSGNATKEMKLAAEKAVKKVPKLIPAKQGDKNVKIKYVIPISFKMN